MTNEIRFYLSGGLTNSNPFNSNGGGISNTEILDGLLSNVWPDISESQALVGYTDHKVIYIKNVSGTGYTGLRAYFGEVDQFVGMGTTTTTTVNNSVPLLSAATDAILDYYMFYQNIAETAAATISLDDVRKRCVLYVGGCANPVYNQYPDKMEIMLKRTGSATGTITAKVWSFAVGPAPSATDNTVVRTLGTLDASTVATTATKYTFADVTDLVSNVFPCVGWRIGIEYTTGTATAKIDVMNSSMAAPVQLTAIYTNAWDGSKWLEFASNIPAINLYTNNGPCFQPVGLPPPGSGPLPPGDCGSSVLNGPAGETAPVGGGGGAEIHGYSIVAGTDNGNDGNGPAGAFDRNVQTRWSANSTNAILTLDMGATHPVDYVKISWFNGDQRIAKFHLAYSTDNTTYTDVPAPAAAANWSSSGTSAGLEQFSIQATQGTAVPNVRYIRYTGLGNSVNTWNSITELEIYGTENPGLPEPTPPPPGGSNAGKPTSYETGIRIPDLPDGAFFALYLERVIPPRTQHSDIDNYSIIVTNDANVKPPTSEPIPQPGPDQPPIGEIPVPFPPGAFDPGEIPLPGEIPPPTDAPGPCAGPPDLPPDQPPNPGGGGTTPDGITLVALPAGKKYGDHYQGPGENFQSNGSYRLDKKVSPQLDQVNLTVYLNLSSGSDEISGKLSGGNHTDSNTKLGRCYDIGIEQGGGRVRIRKENPHPDYHDAISHDISLGSLNGKWIGIQYLKWNEGANCHLQCWVDKSGSETPTNQWQKILDDIDTGQWFEAPYLHCYDSGNSVTTCRVDGMSSSKFHYKFYDAVRIVDG